MGKLTKWKSWRLRVFKIGNTTFLRNTPFNTRTTLTKWTNYGNRKIARRVQRHTRSIFHTHWKWESWRCWASNLEIEKVDEIHKLIRGTILPNAKVDQMEKLTAPGPPSWKNKNSPNTLINPRRKWPNGKITDIAELHAECSDTHVQYFIHIGNEKLPK